MPRLAFFVASQKHIVDQINNSLSLIGVLESLDVATDAHGNPPPLIQVNGDGTTFEAAIVPFDWVAIAQWIALPTDEGRMFEQSVQVVLSDGEATGSGIVPLSFNSAPRFRTTTQGSSLPIRGAGVMNFRLSLREVGEKTGDWQLIAEFPVIIQVVPRI